jgi:hypothetical protein
MLWQCAQDLLVLGKPPFTLLREQELAVGENVELALLALDGRRLVLGALVDLGRETRGPAVVAVSDGAVEDLDACHASEVTGGVPRRALRARCLL